MLPNKIQENDERTARVRTSGSRGPPRSELTKKSGSGVSGWISNIYGAVPNLNFNPNADNRKVELNYYNPDNPNDNLGGRDALGSIFLCLPR